MRRRVWWPCLFNLFARDAFADLCDVGFRLVCAFAFATRLMLLFVPIIRRFVAVFSTVSALTIESRVFNFRISVSLSRMTLFALLALARFPLAFPFSGEDINFHRIVFVSVSSWGRLEDASAPQVIFCCHAQCIKCSRVADVQLKMCFQWLRHIRNDASLFYLIRNGICTVPLRRIVAPIPEIH